MGQDIKAKTKAAVREAVKKPNSITPINSANKNTTYKCSCCGKEYVSQRTNFMTSNSELFKGNNGFITICKSCAKILFEHLVDFYSGNEEHALKHCCWLFDWYYNPDISAATIDNTQTTNRILAYPNRMNLPQFRNKGTTYLDTLIEEHQEMQQEQIPDAPVEPEEKEDPISEEDLKIIETAMEFFGPGYSNEEYKFLYEQYQDWTNRHDCSTKAQEEIFKNLCIAQLNIQRVQRNDGSTKAIADAMTIFQGLLGSANLKPSQKVDITSKEQDTLGTLILKLEKEKPVPEPDPAWKDVDGIGRYVDTYFLGHLSKLLHVENDAAEEYENEMNKDTVTAPEYEGTDEKVDTSLLDKYKEGGGS